VLGHTKSVSVQGSGSPCTSLRCSLDLVNRVITLSLMVTAAVGSLAMASPGRPINPPQSCSVIPPPAPSNYTPWDSDDNYNLSTTQDGSSTKLRISADILRIDAAKFRSLVRNIDVAIPNISEVIFDARKIVINGSLSFSSSHLTFLAEAIEFGPDARITYTSAPGSTGDYLRFVAQVISFDQSPKKPLQIFPSVAPLRAIEIVALAVKSNGSTLMGTEANNALWQRTMASYFLPPPADASWRVDIGDQAGDRYRTIFRSEMYWPLYSSAKLERFHSRDPYGRENQAALKPIIAQLAPEFGAWSDARPLMQLQRVENLMRLDLDVTGKGPAYAPRVAIRQQIDDAKKAIADAEDNAGYLSLLTGLVVAASERKALDSTALAKVAERIQTSDTAIVTIQADTDEALERIAELKQDAAALSTRIEQRRSTIALETASDAKRAEDAAKIKVGTNVLAAGVAIGCMFIPGAQPAGIAIATGITVSGGFIYANNAGGLDTATIGEIVTKGADFYSKMTAISASWEKFKADTSTASNVLNGGMVIVGDAPKAGEKDTRAPMSKVQATQQWGEAAKKLAEAIDAAYKSLDVAKPTMLSGSDREKNDGELNELLSQLGARNKEASDLAARITSNVDLLTVSLNEEHNALNEKDQLLAASVVNDQEIERWKANSLSLWMQYISDTLGKVLTLRRSYFFETGEVPNLPSDVLQYPNELLAFMSSNLYDPADLRSGSLPPDILRAHLESERKKFLVSVEAIVRAIDNGITKTLSKRTDANVYRQTFSFRANSADRIEKHFVQALNSQLAQQIGFNADPQLFPPLVLPLELPKSHLPYPQRFVDAKVTYLKFRNPSVVLNQSGLTFEILHPGYGRIYRGGVCYMFDLRDAGSDNVIGKTTDFNAINPQWPKATPEKINLSDTKNFYTYYPARAPLMIALIVSGNDWRTVPEIEEIDVSLEIMQ
jgi:hypothetical protein